MQNFSIHPKEIGISFWRNRGLIWQMSKREILGTYRGSVLGVLWSFINPLLMLSMYTIVFGYVFQSRWGMENESKADFALLLFIGLSVFQLFSANFTRAPGLILSNAQYVKKVVFPLEIYPFISLVVSLFHVFLNFILIIIFYSILRLEFPVYAIFIPLAILPLMIFILGISWFLSALGVYFRDLGQIILFINTMLMFLSPIFFPMSRLPAFLQSVAKFNPLTFPLEWVRNMFLKSTLPDPIEFVLFTFYSLLVFWLGFIFFQKSRKGFADVV